MSTTLNSIQKTTLEWMPVKTKNSVTGEGVVYPRVTNKEKYDASRLVKFAMDNGYIHGGQYHSNLGLFNGVMEAARTLIFMGKDVKLSSWMRYHTEMSGKGAYDPSIGELDKTKLKLKIRAQMLEDFKLSPSDFVFEQVNVNIAKAYITSLQALGWSNNHEILPDRQIAVSGSRLDYTPGIDSVIAKWTEVDGAGATVDKSVELTPLHAGSNTMVLAADEELSTAPIDTEVTFIFRLGGDAEKKVTVIPVEYTAKVVVDGDTPVSPKLTRLHSTVLDKDGEIHFEGDTLEIEGIGFTEDVTGKFEVYKPDGTLYATMPLTEGNAFERVSDKKLTFKLVTNTSPQPDAVWLNASNTKKITVVTAAGEATRVIDVK